MARVLDHRGHQDPEIIEFTGTAIGRVGDVADPTENRNTGLHVGDDGVHVFMDGFLTNAALLLGRRDRRATPAASNDAHVLARLYDRHGESIFEKLEGAYAAAVWDSRRKRLILARDAMGHKPIFYAETGNGFLFASEVKALIGANSVAFALDRESLSHFLSMRFLPAPHTMVKGISKLGSGQMLVYENSVSRVHQYWVPTFARKSDASLEETIDELDNRLSGAVGRVLPPRGKPGSFLSGGLDSGLLVANLAKILQAPFDTFSLGVENESDEVPLARLVSKKFNTIQHDLYPDEQLIGILPKLIWHTDEPSDMVAVTGFLLTRFAAPHVDFCLAGDGGDELFAGFPRYRGVRDAKYFRLVPAVIRDAIVAPIASGLGGRLGPNNLPGKVAWLAKVSAYNSLAEQYMAAIEFLRFNHAGKKELLTQDTWEQVQHVRSEQLIADLVTACDAEHPIEKLLFTDLLTRLPEHLLMISDRAGAAHGLDVLSPYTDKDLVEFSTTIPLNMKIRGRQSKYIERRLAQRVLPHQIISSHKTGWSFPFAELCAGSLLPFLRSVFSRSLLVEHEILRLDEINRLLLEHASRKADHHIRIWMLLSLEIWYRMAGTGTHYSDIMPWLESHLRVELPDLQYE
jgi:asparagine synthase (glutamine-hydrolysing)